MSWSWSQNRISSLRLEARVLARDQDLNHDQYLAILWKIFTCAYTWLDTVHHLDRVYIDVSAIACVYYVYYQVSFCYANIADMSDNIIRCLLILIQRSMIVNVHKYVGLMSAVCCEQRQNAGMDRWCISLSSLLVTKVCLYFAINAWIYVPYH